MAHELPLAGHLRVNHNVLNHFFWPGYGKIMLTTVGPACLSYGWQKIPSAPLILTPAFE